MCWWSGWWTHRRRCRRRQRFAPVPVAMLPLAAGELAGDCAAADDSEAAMEEAALAPAEAALDVAESLALDPHPARARAAAEDSPMTARRTL